MNKLSQDPQILAALDLLGAETPFTIEFHRIAKAICSIAPPLPGDESDEQARVALAEWWATLTAQEQQAVGDEYQAKRIAAFLLRQVADLGPMDLLPDEARGA